MRPSLLPLLASACFGFGFVQPPRVGPAASRPALLRSFGRASLGASGAELGRAGGRSLAPAIAQGGTADGSLKSK